MAKKILADYYIPGGKQVASPFKLSTLPTLAPNAAMDELIVVANFAEVFLAKEGHDGIVGVNFLEKIQIPTLPSIYGAMLADVDFILMGAGIPRSIPAALDALASGKPTSISINVQGALAGESSVATFDPAKFCRCAPPILKRPNFLAIVSSSTLAATLVKKSNGVIQGFVVEGPTAGGHNAPPRGTLQLTPEGEPIYGARDVPELEKIRALGLPFWLAGSFATSGKFSEAQQLGAAGVQIGTAFAFCNESGIAPAIKTRILELCRSGQASVLTDSKASPTGFPFKVAHLNATMSEASDYEARPRICDLGYLRHPYRKEDGSVGYRCPGEPVSDFLLKGGALKETEGRKCFCNGLLATVGLEQVRADGQVELPLITAGNDLALIRRFIPPGATSYSAADVINQVLEHVSHSPGTANKS
jgi:NAD(P)H-dependent flavin oxidoreductase YrpB (nitropropane dioxygenase family)